LYELAVANPVYFLPAGFERPKACGATVSLQVLDEAGKGIAGILTVVDEGEEIATHAIPADGTIVVQAPATAALRIGAPGYADEQRSLYMDTELFSYCRNMNELYPSFYSPETWQELRSLLSKLRLRVSLKKQ
jgi:hypothetical protein